MTTAQLSVDTAEVLRGEPILLTLEVDDESVSLPWHAAPEGPVELAFDAPVSPVEPDEPDAVDPSDRRAGPAAVYNALDYYTYDEEFGGELTIRASVDIGTETVETNPVTVTVEEPPSDETEAFERFHHFPWINYIPDQYCGDTFDVTTEWPDSQFAKYAHYYSGRHLQFTDDHEGAIGEFKEVISYPDFALTPEAKYQIGRSQLELGNTEQAHEIFDAILAQHADAPAAYDVEHQLATQ